MKRYNAYEIIPGQRDTNGSLSGLRCIKEYNKDGNICHYRTYDEYGNLKNYKFYDDNGNCVADEQYTLKIYYDSCNRGVLYEYYIDDELAFTRNVAYYTPAE